MRLSDGAAILALGIAAIFGRAAQAAPEEIDVYLDDMRDPGELGLNIHLNTVATGRLTDEYLGQQQSVGRQRLTPEIAYGVTPTLEAGLFLPLASLDRYGHASLNGVKLRLKFLAPKVEGQSWFWGANLEIGRVDRKLDINPYNGEFSAILGRHGGPWTLALNVNVDFKLSGPEPSPASLDLDTKLSYALTENLAVGVESYNGAGDVGRLGDFGMSDQSTFATADLSFGAWDINLGIGSGYGANPDHLIIKAIVGMPIN